MYTASSSFYSRHQLFQRISGARSEHTAAAVERQLHSKIFRLKIFTIFKSPFQSDEVTLFMYAGIMTCELAEQGSKGLTMLSPGTVRKRNDKGALWRNEQASRRW